MIPWSHRLVSNLSHDIMVKQTGGQPNALRARRSCGGGQEGSQTHSELSSQTHSEPGGVVEGARRAAKRTQN